MSNNMISVSANNDMVRVNSNSIWATYDAKKVQKVLENIDTVERKAYYETMGIKLENCTSMESALKLSGLDFEVAKKPIYINVNADEKNENGKPLAPKFQKFPDFVSTVRTDNNQPLGIVTPSYEILQNRDAFDFLDSLCVEGAKFETAGLFKKNGAASYITMSTEPISILGDEFDPYMMISNSFDGKNSVVICLTPIRAVCKNSAILAIKKATNIIRIQHSKQLNVRMEQAKEIMLANSDYMKELNKIAEELAVKPFSEEAFEKMIRNMYPVKEEDKELIQIRNLGYIEQLMRAYKEEDLQNFNGTAYKALQAVSDFESHKVSYRKTNTIGDKGSYGFQVVMNGMPLLNAVYERLVEAA